jgi:hypothetical protein
MVGDHGVIGHVSSDQRGGPAAARGKVALMVGLPGQRPVGFGMTEKHQTAHEVRSTGQGANSGRH